MEKYNYLKAVTEEAKNWLREQLNKIIINTNAILLIDNKTTTKIWLKEFDDAIYVLESYAYIRYELNNNKRK